MDDSILYILGQIGPPWLVAMGLALFLFLFSFLLVDRSLLRVAVKTALVGMAFIPGVGIFAGMIYDLIEHDASFILVSAAITLVVLPLVVLPADSEPIFYPNSYEGDRVGEADGGRGPQVLSLPNRLLGHLANYCQMAPLRRSVVNIPLMKTDPGL